jgi:hypothetical protein
VNRLRWKPKPIRLRQTRAARVGARQPLPDFDGWKISSDTRLFVWQRDQGRCKNCGSTQSLQFDHVVPRSLGGAGTAANVELLCKTCNLRKGARLFAPGVLAPTGSGHVRGRDQNSEPQRDGLPAALVSMDTGGRTSTLAPEPLISFCETPNDNGDKQ